MSDGPLLPDPWLALRRLTTARIATGRAGGSLPTREVLQFEMDHAIARDAVYSQLDMDALDAVLRPLGLPVVRVNTCVNDRLAYLKSPDLGRRLDPESRTWLSETAQRRANAPDIVIMIADGLSATAAQQNAPPLLHALIPSLQQAKLDIGPVVLARFARVALQDDVGASLNAQACVILLGERPGLGTADSLGAYYVFNPKVGNTDAQRNCVSNIRPAGLPVAQAAETLTYLITESLRRRLSGTALKDERNASLRRLGSV